MGINPVFLLINSSFFASILNMAIAKKILNFLDKNETKYRIVEHKKVYTAIDKARTLKMKDSLVGKTVVLKADRDYFILLMAADKIIDKVKIKKILSQWRKKNNQKVFKKIDFAKEKWIKENLKGAKMGSVPPFGVIWGIETICDDSFLRNKKILINSGDHYSSLEMTSSNFKKILPEMIKGSFSKKRKKKK